MARFVRTVHLLFVFATRRDTESDEAGSFAEAFEVRLLCLPDGAWRDFQHPDGVGLAGGGDGKGKAIKLVCSTQPAEFGEEETA
jgi:hypothetical protein